ncbi:MAG: hypothetical protein A2W91_11860 [Bacteroidetes bacterium GWF2_38_335]|nr:MAG: hypothetical protein A2W91_11860 [Bacteroidetes bacterium GWF2_38_335]OFY77973.1 MAG: hypothetical protein A2281_18605 [Bacteroidetes bacterium RIFOXYA12_FULL_38_20]HBS86716.1 aminopeptidase [Bacteroidales bacterium]
MKLLIALFALCLTFGLTAQENHKDYSFSKIYDLKTTPVKNQQSSGTCWSFATVSFLETEILRTKNIEIDLSEMFFVRMAYFTKAELYIRLHGNSNFSEGGQAHDVFNVLRKYGMVTEETYKGLCYGEEQHVHSELVDGLKGYISGVNKKSNGKLSTAWTAAVNGILDAYFCTVPKNFSYEGKTYKPTEFVGFSGINPDDYIEITSYSNEPFYKKIILRIPDNWSGDQYYNVPADDMMKIIENALKNGYSVCWDGDVSERSFCFSAGIAIIPDDDWSDISRAEAAKKFESYNKEKAVTQEMRQLTFDNLTTTDDHLMHITGMYKDAKGVFYYKTKNSWSAESNSQGGYLMMSDSYVRLKTTAILIHKKAVPEELAKKIGVN